MSDLTDNPVDHSELDEWLRSTRVAFDLPDDDDDDGKSPSAEHTPRLQNHSDHHHPPPSTAASISRRNSEPVHRHTTGALAAQQQERQLRRTSLDDLDKPAGLNFGIDEATLLLAFNANAAMLDDCEAEAAAADIETGPISPLEDAAASSPSVMP